MKPSNGWAILQGQEIIIETISPTRRAAIVNWMVAIQKILITRWDQDEWIFREFEKLGRDCGAKVIRVRISAMIEVE